MSTHEGMYDRLLRSSATNTIFSETRQLQSMLAFEAALAQVEAELGLIPAAAAGPICECCVAETFDHVALMEGAARSGNLAIPMVKQLTQAVERVSPEAALYVHWGATSQDAIDTGLMLQLRDLLEVCDQQLALLCARLAELAATHRDSVMAGRTWLQHAVPVTFGLKAAGWLEAMLRHRERLEQMRPRVLLLQFGGAAGTLASLGARGREVSVALAGLLGLRLPELPWHANRDPVVEVATFLGLLMGTTGKIARDLALLGQTEIGEVAEGYEPGRGGSSTMPHKRNPVLAAAILSSAIRMPSLVATMLSAMDQEHERGLGGWHAEWETLPEICTLTMGAVESLEKMLVNLQVFPDAMRHNLEQTRGLLLAEALSMALAERLGKAKAHALVEQIVRKTIETHDSLQAVAAADPRVLEHLGRERLDQVFRVDEYLGSKQTMIDGVLERYAGSRVRVETGSA